MPQVDIVTFSSQNFWLVISFIAFTTFICLYFLIFFGVYYRVHSKYIEFHNSQLKNLLDLSGDLFKLYNNSFIIISELYYKKLKNKLNFLDNFIKLKFSFNSIKLLYASVFKKYRSLISF